MTLLVAAAAAPTAAAGGTFTALVEDFEATATGSYPPAPWRNIFSGCAGSVGTPGQDSPRGFVLQGCPWYGRADGVHLPPDYQVVVLRASARVLEGSTNAHESSIDIFHQTDGSNGIGTAAVNFGGAGSARTILFQSNVATVPLGHWSPGKWYPVTTTYWAANRTACTTVVADAGPAGGCLAWASNAPARPGLAYFGANWGWTMAYDNVVVASSASPLDPALLLPPTAPVAPGDAAVEGERTRTSVAGNASRVLEGIGAARIALEGALGDLSRTVTAGFTGLQRSITDLGSTVAAGFAEAGRATAALAERLDEARATEPLQVGLAPVAGAAPGDGPFLATVQLRGRLHDASLAVLLDGAPWAEAQPERLAPGVYRIANPGLPRPGAHVLAVEATVERHLGVATAPFGLGAASAAGPPLARLGRTLDPVFVAPEAADPREVEVVAVAHDLPPIHAATPGVAPVATLRGEPSTGGDYVLAWSVAGRAQGSLALPGLGAALGPLHLDLVPLAPAGASTPGLRVDLRVAYRYDDAAAPCPDPGTPGCLRLPAPVSAPWLAGPGLESALVVRVRVGDPAGGTVEEQTVVVPLAGQLVGWMGMLPATTA